jgi:cell wall-associated NlpC family hydrolase
LKNLVVICGIVVLSSCASSKKTTTAPARETGKTSDKNKQPKFIEDISINPTGATRKKTAANPPVVDASVGSGSSAASSSNKVKTFGELQFKYAILLDVPVEEVDNERMFSYIESWYGTPYRYGGFSRDGVDCSGFTQNFMSAVYEVNLPRIAAEQYNQTKRISRKELREGDLVFFKTSGTSISHVGIYLRNHKFVHASTSGGVMINDLNDDYYARRFAGSGRIR